jgi:ATP-binding cassette, subfamily F, member 3
MLSTQNVTLRFGERVLFDNISFTLNSGDRAGLTGRNGAGKSTLLKIIAGEKKPDEGKVITPNGVTIAYLHQDLLMPSDKTILEEAQTAFEEYHYLETRILEVEKELTERTDYESEEYSKLIEEISDVSERLSHMGAGSLEGDTVKILLGLGFQQKDLNRPLAEFSGGWKMRVELAKMLLKQPDILLLDEPTNHLDIESIIWLENFLKNNFKGGLILISHDKRFLDGCTNRTFEVELGRFYEYKGNYSTYIEASALRREQMQNAFENQQRMIIDKERTIARFMAKATKTTMAQSMQKQLDKMERIEIVENDTSAMRIKLPPATRSGQIVMESKGIHKSYGDLKVLKGVDLKIERGERIAFVGQNGQGKTTLTKIFVGTETATEGESVTGHQVTVGYYAQDQSDTLFANKNILETVEDIAPPEMRTSVRGILGALMFSGEDVEKKVSVLSGGERARVALACMLVKSFNFLVLDEPTNHLDITSKNQLKKALEQYEGTLLIVSHDRDFLTGLTDKVYEFHDGNIKEYLGDIEYFLEKKKVDNMHAFEMDKVKVSNTKVKLSAEERETQKRKAQKNLQSSEKKLEDLNKEAKKLEDKMSDPSFYGSPNSDKVLADYQALKLQIALATEVWEASFMEWEEVQG